VVDETVLATNDTKDFSGLFTAGSFGADGAGTKTYSLNVSSVGVDSGLIDVASGQHIFLYKVSNALVEGRVGSGGVADPLGAIAFTVAVNGSGLVTLDQIRALQHSPDTGTNQSISMTTDSLITLSAVITDKEGDSATASINIASNLTFNDDAPSAFNPQDASLTNAAGGPVPFQLDPIANGGDNNIMNNFGADGAGSVRFPSTIDNTDSGLTAGGVKIWYILDASGQNLLGKTGTSAANAEASGTTIFTITINQATSQYTIDMDGAVDAFTTVNFTDAAFDFIGGNKGWFGVVPNTENSTPVDNDSHDLLITPTNNTSINSSGILGGVDTGQSVGAGEGFRIDYVVDLSGSPPNNYVPLGDGSAANNNWHINDNLVTDVGEQNHWYTNGAFVTMRQSTGSDVKFTAYNDTDNDQVVGDGAVDTITKIVITFTNSGGTKFTSGDLVRVDTLSHNVILNGVTFSYQFNADGTVDVHNVQGATGANDNPATTVAIFTDTNVGFVPSAADPLGYDSLVVTHIGGDEFKFAGFGAVTQSTDPVVFHLPVEIVDADGDTVAATTTIDITLTPPVVLDLNGDGVHFLDRGAGVTYDYNGDGVAEATAWAAADDGILVRDANGNGTVDNASEFVFGGHGVTDMEALRAQYGDTLDANDADFATFKVWQDANSNGVVDDGELISLTDAGIASISLVTDGESYTAANGDVIVAGSSTFTKIDGNTGEAADAAFVTGSKSTMEQERVAANSNNLVLAAAVAAAGLAVSTPAAASVGGDEAPVNHFTNAVVSVEPVNLSVLNLATETAMPALMGEMREAFVTAHLPIHSTMSAELGAGTVGDLMSDFSAAMATTALLEGSEMIASQAAMPMLASNVAMPSADAMMAMAGLNNIQSSVTIETIVADALHGGGSGPDINALLNALPGQGIAANGGTEIMASLGNGAVPTWDMGHGAGFTFAGTNVITNEAMVLHHDAIQPVANG
jgi:hypothetical protein